MNLIDAALLILATALGLCAIRPFIGSFFQAPLVQVDGLWVERWWEPVVLLNRALVFEVVLMAWTVGWAFMQLRQPRPSLRRMARQPGFVATSSAATVVLVCGLLAGAVIGLGPRPYPALRGYNVWLTMWSAIVSFQVGAAVLAGWVVLALGRRCLCGVTWLEAPARILGAIWLLMMPANLTLLLWYLSF